jgi:putative nucleotidyltransferase with HDIG domain
MDRADDRLISGEAGTSQRVNIDGNEVDRELAAIIPVIADIALNQIQASSCAFYIYRADTLDTAIVFRHGEAVIFEPHSSTYDSVPPTDVPVETEILRTGESVRRSTPEDFQRWPMLNTTLVSYDDGFVDLVVPLKRNGKIYGVTYFWRYGEPGPFTDHDIEVAERLTSVAAMAVEYARQYGTERVRRTQLQALLDVTALASSHLTVDEVLPPVTEIARHVTGADVCNLFVYDDAGEYVVNAYSSGLDQRDSWVIEKSATIPLSAVPCEVKAKQTGQPVIVRDVENEVSSNSQLAKQARTLEISEILVVPIIYREEMIGIIYLWYQSSDRSFDSQSIETIQGIANQAGGVIHQARLYDSWSQHLAETEALRQIGETVLHSSSLNTTLDQIAEVFARMIPYDYAYYGMIDEHEDEVVVERIWGDFPPELLRYRISIPNSLTGAAIRSGEIINLPDAFSDPRQQEYRPTKLGIRSVMISPFQTESGTIGVIYLARRESGGFTARQERLMELLCQHAAVAIKRNQTRDMLALHAQRQSFLANVTNWLISTPDPVDAIPQIVEEACGVLADGVAVALSSWEYGELRWIAGKHRDPVANEHLSHAIEHDLVAVDPDRVEAMLSAESPSLVEFRNGTPADGRPLLPGTLRILRELNARQMLTVPMHQRERAPGVLVLVSSSPQFSIEGALSNLAQIVANRIGDALERQQMARNREALLRFSEAINTHLDLDTLTQLFADELYQILPYDQIYLGLRDDEGASTKPFLYYNPHGLSVDEITLASNEGISGEVMRTRKAVLDNHAHVRETSAYGSSSEAEFYRQNGESVMATPLLVDDQVIGTLFVGRSGANRFSESDFETFLLFAGLASSAIQRTRLLQHNQELYRASVEVLAAVVDAKDPTTLRHSRNVAHFARVIAEQCRMNAAEVEQIELAGLLHDIGKLSIPDHVLSKPGPLTTQERALINTHPERGARILNQHPALLGLIPFVRHHHERFDGNGYPDGISGDDIPFGARILSVADALDTMISERTYQKQKCLKEAVRELCDNTGTQFDVTIVDTLVTLIDNDPAAVEVPGARGPTEVFTQP